MHENEGENEPLSVTFKRGCSGLIYVLSDERISNSMNYVSYIFDQATFPSLYSVNCQVFNICRCNNRIENGMELPATL